MEWPNNTYNQVPTFCRRRHGSCNNNGIFTVKRRKTTEDTVVLGTGTTSSPLDWRYSSETTYFDLRFEAEPEVRTPRWGHEEDYQVSVEYVSELCLDDSRRVYGSTVDPMTFPGPNWITPGLVPVTVVFFDSSVEDREERHGGEGRRDE